MEEIEPGFYKELFAEDEFYLLDEGGADLKDVCIVLDKKLTAKNELFLGKILNAVKLSLFNTSILYSEHVPSCTELETKVVLIFDETHAEKVDNYAHTKVKEGAMTVLKCDGLDKVATDKALKGKLWGELQKMFL